MKRKEGVITLAVIFGIIAILIVRAVQLQKLKSRFTIELKENQMIISQGIEAFESGDYKKVSEDLEGRLYWSNDKKARFYLAKSQFELGEYAELKQTLFYETDEEIIDIYGKILNSQEIIEILKKNNVVSYSNYLSDEEAELMINASVITKDNEKLINALRYTDNYTIRYEALTTLGEMERAKKYKNGYLLEKAKKYYEKKEYEEVVEIYLSNNLRLTNSRLILLIDSLIKVKNYKEASNYIDRYLKGKNEDEVDPFIWEAINVVYAKLNEKYKYIRESYTLRELVKKNGQFYIKQVSIEEPNEKRGSSYTEIDENGNVIAIYNNYVDFFPFFTVKEDLYEKMEFEYSGGKITQMNLIPLDKEIPEIKIELEYDNQNVYLKNGRYFFNNKKYMEFEKTFTVLDSELAEFVTKYTYSDFINSSEFLNYMAKKYEFDDIQIMNEVVGIQEFKNNSLVDTRITVTNMRGDSCLAYLEEISKSEGGQRTKTKVFMRKPKDVKGVKNRDIFKEKPESTENFDYSYANMSVTYYSHVNTDITEEELAKDITLLERVSEHCVIIWETGEIEIMEREGVGFSSIYESSDIAENFLLEKYGVKEVGKDKIYEVPTRWIDYLYPDIKRELSNEEERMVLDELGLENEMFNLEYVFRDGLIRSMGYDEVRVDFVYERINKDMYMEFLRLTDNLVAY